MIQQYWSVLCRHRELHYILLIILVFAVGALSIWGPGGYLDVKRAQLDLYGLRSQVRDLNRSNEVKMNRIRALRDSKDTLEEYARDKGYARKDEIILHLPSQDAPDTNSGR